MKKNRLSVNETFGQALIAAAMERNAELIELLVASGADVNAENKNVVSDSYDYKDSTALVIAAGDDHKKCVKTLIRLGADVNKANEEGTTPLIAAADCWRYNIDTVRFLVESGADVNATDSKEETALIKSARDTLKTKFLLESGADPHAISSHGRTTLMHAAAWSENVVVKTLIEMGADVNATNENGYDSMTIAVLEVGIGFFFSKYIDLDKFVPRDMTSPYTQYGKYNDFISFFRPSESERNQQDCVNLLLSAGIDANHATESGWTAIMIAALKGQVDIIKSLLKSGAKVNARSYYGWSAVISALIADHHECVQYLIESGADVNIQVRPFGSKKKRSVSSKSALGFAADIGNIDTILLLLQSGVHKDGVFVYPTTKSDVKEILEAAGACSRMDDSDSSLQNRCLEVIRRHLLDTDPPVNLYWKIKHLGLPSLLEHYLLFNIPALRRKF